MKQVYKIVRTDLDGEGKYHSSTDIGLVKSLDEAFQWLTKNKLTRLGICGFENPNVGDTRQSRYSIKTVEFLGFIGAEDKG